MIRTRGFRRGASLKTPNEGSGAKSHRKNSILNISKAKFGLIKVLFYYSKTQHFYSIILLWNWSPRFWKGKFNHSISIDSIKCLVLTKIVLRLFSKPWCRCQLKFQSNICDRALLLYLEFPHCAFCSNLWETYRINRGNYGSEI